MSIYCSHWSVADEHDPTCKRIEQSHGRFTVNYSSPCTCKTEFRDRQSVKFNLKNLEDCRFLFGKYGDAVHQNAHNQSHEHSFVIAAFDGQTITISPAEGKQA